MNAYIIYSADAFWWWIITEKKLIFLFDSTVWVWKYVTSGSVKTVYASATRHHGVYPLFTAIRVTSNLTKMVGMHRLKVEAWSGSSTHLFIHVCLWFCSRPAVLGLIMMCHNWHIWAASCALFVVTVGGQYLCWLRLLMVLMESCLRKRENDNPAAINDNS